MDLEEIKNKLRNPGQYGQATPEEAEFAYKSGYMGGPETQKYYKELGLLEPPKDTVTTNAMEGDPRFQPKPTTNAMEGGPRFQPKPTSNAMEGDPRFQPNAMEGDPRFQSKEQSVTEQTEQPVEQTQQPVEQTQQARQTHNFGKFKDTDVFNRGIQAWSPLAPSLISGGDRSGEASGYRAGAAIQDKAAAENEKFMQWNKQRATDNTLADKIAAAQASGQWRQNANALGAEGGASAVASQNVAVNPDIMAQKQYQSQQMNTATQNLAEVNARKVAAQNNRTKANQTDYNTQVQESQNAYKYNLATANDQSEKEKKEKKPEEPKQENKPEEPKQENKSVEQPTDESKAAAETNQQSQATADATQVAADKQTVTSLIDEVNDLNNNTVPDLHNGRDGKQMTKAEHYALIEQEYNQIKARTPDIPALPPLNVPAGNIANAINDITN